MDSIARVQSAFLLLVAIALYVFSGHADTWSLEELLAHGFRTAPAIREARAEMEAAEAEVNMALADYFPRLDAGGRLLYAPEQFSPLAAEKNVSLSALGFLDSAGFGNQADRLLAVYLDTALGEIQDSYLSPAPFQVSFSLGVRQPLFAQGKITARHTIAKTYQRSLLCKYQSAQERVKAAITRRFYKALLADENKTVQKQAVTLAHESHRLTVDRFTAGAASELDTLNSRMHLDRIELGYQDAQSSRTNAYESLVAAAGIAESAETVILHGDIPDDAFSITLDEAFQRMRTDNKKLGQLQSAGQIRDQTIRINRLDFLPSLSAGASAAKISQFEPGESLFWQDDYRLWLQVEWNLFSGLKRMYRLRKSVADRRAFWATRNETEENLELAVRKTWLELEDARKRLEKTRSLVSMAEKRYAIARKAYELGQQRLVDFQTSELALNQARLGLNQARFRFYSKVVDMRVLIGDYLYDE